MSATCFFAKVIALGEINELNGCVAYGKTLAEGQDLLFPCLKYFRINMTNDSVDSNLKFSTHCSLTR